MRGHITKRGDSWTAIVDLPADPATGKRRQKRITARTKREVELQVAELIHKAENGGFTDAGKVTVREFFDQWLISVAPSLRPSTARRYRDLARLHIASVIGNLKLAKLAPGDVQRLYADRLAYGLSPTSVQHVHGLMHRALGDAVRWGLLIRNVTDAVDAPRRATTEMKTWDAGQVARVLTAAVCDDLEALWRLALLTGMRRGEVLGLRWADVDLDAGALSVRRTISRGETGRLVEGEPKTACGRRRIALPASGVESLRRHRVRQLEHRLAVGPGVRGSRARLHERDGRAVAAERSRAAVPPVDRRGKRPGDPVPRPPAHVRDAAPVPRGASEGRAGTARPRQHRRYDEPVLPRHGGHAAAGCGSA